MRGAMGCGVLGLLTACSASETVSEPAAIMAASAAPSSPQAASTPPLPDACDLVDDTLDTGIPCAPLSFELEVQRACTVRQVDCRRPLDALGRVGETPVMAANRFGAGHIAGWCDGTTLGQLVAAIPILPYLGGSETPRVATVGGGYGCDPSQATDNPTVQGATYLGLGLPEPYRHDSAALAEDFDVLVVCAMNTPQSDLSNITAYAAPFVAEHGRGVLVALDWTFESPSTSHGLMSMLGAPAGFVFENLEVPDGTAVVDEACVADW